MLINVWSKACRIHDGNIISSYVRDLRIKWSFHTEVWHIKSLQIYHSWQVGFWLLNLNAFLVWLRAGFFKPVILDTVICNKIILEMIQVGFFKKNSPPSRKSVSVQKFIFGTISNSQPSRYRAVVNLLVNLLFFSFTNLWITCTQIAIIRSDHVNIDLAGKLEKRKEINHVQNWCG